MKIKVSLHVKSSRVVALSLLTQTFSNWDIDPDLFIQNEDGSYDHLGDIANIEIGDQIIKIYYYGIDSVITDPVNEITISYTRDYNSSITIDTDYCGDIYISGTQVETGKVVSVGLILPKMPSQ